ncbi:HlyD family type I secretion periplasmic adaptor subunit [Brenneria izbisi]|uniref:Membrane fusion protein (MFP) family protein n=1 Tax=Brenneria izbisi TaxID=2939450 RepID=A0AA41Y3Z4_9GAMM|nr:HlyD family type I secretion periplasmic adaptor subunit [Brenneria izbisi]MCV9880214.1 HlyD family type I secretion periplasmic adaptor subunit [Brenneria izbisi]MCV9883680.1 HlyD family type I secretion periplasmic adaptor subunit [Brenneria izbisi]
MRLANYIQRIKRYFIGDDDQDNLQTMPEVNRAIIEDSPRVVRFTLWTIGAFFLFFILWAAFADIDEVTRGSGKAIPSSRLQKIQNLEGGIVTEVFIHEGQIVNAGDPLLRLDDTRFASNVGETEADRLALTLRIERLNAEINDRELVLSEEASAQTPEVANGERELYNSRRQQFHNEISGLEEQLVQRRQELRDFSAKQIQFRNSLNLLQQEIRMSEPLIAAGAISKVEVLRLRRAEVEIKGQLDSVILSIPRAESAIKEIENKIEEARGRYKSDALSQLNEAQTNLNKLTATGKALEDRVKRTLVVSPVRGIIQQIMVNTIGGVIQPGSDLVEIVPLDDKLLVEARVRPQDIAFLHPGQEAIIKLTAYDYTVYGGLKGRLEQISPDTVTDEEGNSFYIIRLRTDKNYLGTEEKPLLIIPGMVASVDIITGKKTILSYLLKPIIRARAEALRER